MKKNIYFGIVISFILLFVIILQSNVYANEITTTINGEEINWEYDVNDNDEVVNLKCLNPGDLAGEVALPATINNKPVVSFKNSCIEGASNVTKIIIPNTVTEIGHDAFAGTGITELVLPDSVKEVSYDAFKNCSNLKKITIPETCTQMGLYYSFPTQDTVFENHNEDLTIYCYKDSIAHQYAVSNNIKFELLTKPTTPINEEQNDNEDSKENEEKKDEVKTDDTKKTDKTVANKDLSNTGNSPIILYAIGVVFLMGTVGVIYLRKYRKI